jgi:hypothetical protein
MHALEAPGAPLSEAAARAAEWTRCMRRGDFATAWRISDALLLRRGARADEARKPRHLQRVWDGADVRGQRVLVRCYRGLGDTVFFARYLPLLRERAAEVVLWAQPALLPLLREIEGVDHVLPLHDGEPEAEADVELELSELAHLFRTRLETIPARVPYLRIPASSAAVERATPRAGDELVASKRLAPARAPARRIAFAWRAGDWDPRRSIPPELAARMLSGVDCALDVLLPALTPAERALFPPPSAPNTIADAAARIASADLVISVDTVFAHLAGALARPVWILLPHEADWRWLEQRRDSPWYPTATLFRQKRAGDWSDVGEEVREVLSRFAA